MSIFQQSNKYQQGLATLLMSVFLVLTISLISMYSAQVSVIEQKISANHFRSKQAFESAQAGLDASIFRLTGSIVSGLSAGVGGGAPIGTENDLPFDSYHKATFQSGAGKGHYILRFQQQGGTPSKVDFTVYGFAGDNPSIDKNDADQTIQQTVQRTPVLKYQPPANIISLGSVNTGIRLSISNLTGTKLAAIWSGGATIVGAGTAIWTTPGRTGVYQNDAALNGLTSAPTGAAAKQYLTQNNKFFDNFFGDSKPRFKKRSTILDCEAGCTTADIRTQLVSMNKINADGSNLRAQVIWIDAYNETSNAVSTINFNQNFTFGSAQTPVILIVEGNVTFNHPQAMINGIIYTTSDFNNGNGQGAIMGSLITEGNFSTTGRMTFFYDNDNTMTNVMNSDGTNRYIRIAGTWKDF